MKKPKILPSDFKDYLSLISFVGFIAIFLSYTFDITLLIQRIDAVFLILSGVGLMVIGKVFSVGKWAKDGIQKGEFTQTLSLVIGLSSIIIGLIVAFGLSIPLRFSGFVGIVALFPALFILADYIKKNN